MSAKELQMSEEELDPRVAEMVGKLVEARTDEVLEALESVCEVMRAMGMGSGEPSASIMARVDEQLSWGRGQEALITKALPDLALAYDQHYGLGPDEAVGQRIRELVFGRNPQHAVVEFAYILEGQIYAEGLAGD